MATVADASDPTTADGARPGWSPARRAAQEARGVRGERGDRLDVPLVLPGRGVVGHADLPADLDGQDWDIILGTLNAYRYATQGPQP